MARGIEAACWGSATKDGEVRQSKAGNDFGIVNIAVSEGKTDDAGKEMSTYLKILLFGGLAHEAANIKKGDRIYCEGSLGAEVWTGATDGKPRLDLSIRAFKFERTQIGKQRPRRENGHEIPASSFAGQEPREKLRIQGRDSAMRSHSRTGAMRNLFPTASRYMKPRRPKPPRKYVRAAFNCKIERPDRPFEFDDPLDVFPPAKDMKPRPRMPRPVQRRHASKTFAEELKRYEQGERT